MAKSLRILILENNPADAEMVQFELEEAGLIFTSKVVMTKKDFVHELQEFSPDLILSDYDLPTYNGALALAEAKKRCPDTPFILITGAVSEDRAIEILTQGAKDYVLKNRLEQRLVPAVRRALAEAEEHRARKKAEAEIRKAHRTLEERVKIRTAELEAEMMARQKVDEALREAYDRTSAILETIADSFYSLDDQWRFVMVNPAAERAPFGRPAGELIGKVIWDVFPAIVGTRIQQHYFDAVKNCNLEHYEVLSPLNDRWYEVFIFPRKKGLDVCLRDITERRKAEEENKRLLNSIQEERDKRQALVNSIGDFTLANPSAFNGFGLNFNGDIVDVRKLAESVEVFRPDGGPRPVEEAPPLRALRSEVVRNQEEMIRTTATGELRYRQVSSNPVKNAGGQIIESASVMRDITENRRVEEKLWESEERFRAFMDNSPGIAWIKDEEGRHVYLNKSYEQRFGVRLNDWYGRTDFELWPPETANVFRMNDLAVLSNGQPMEVIEQMSKPDGTTAYWWNFKFLIQDAAGNKYTAGYGIDITARKQAREALKKQTQQLEDAGKELESFSYAVSHDLKAALCAIEGNSRMLLKKDVDKLSEDIVCKLEAIRRNAAKMNVLIDDLLLFSKALKNSSMAPPQP